MKLIDDLRWRGLISSTSGNLEEILSKPTTFYVGTDPTGKSLHVGHLLAFTTAKLLQQYGHKPIILIGGATAVIGDPSFKSDERNAISQEVVDKNAENIKKQVSHLIKFTDDVKMTGNDAIMVNNYDWMKNVSFLDFTRDIGKHITVNYMMAKESVKKRLEREGSGMSFQEFTYQLMQGSDFLELYKRYGCQLQIGGQDQFGNCTTGIELIRKILGKTDVGALTWPLVTRADGTKFGKSEGGKNIWLDAEMTSPYEFYQFWLNQSDADAERFIKLFTLINKEQIESLISRHKEHPEARELQKTLASYLTKMIHGEKELEKAIKASNILFGKATTEDLESLDNKTFSAVMEQVPQVSATISDVNGTPIVDFLSSVVNLGSKTEVRKLVSNGAISINKNKINDIKKCITTDMMLNNGTILVQKGKRNYTLVKVGL